MDHSPFPFASHSYLYAMKFISVIRTLSIFMILASCSDPNAIPPGVLSKDKMVEILKMVHLAEATQQQMILDQSANPSDTFSFNEIFKKAKIKKADYDSSMKFYSAHPQLLDQVYDEVINELNEMSLEESKKK